MTDIIRLDAATLAAKIVAKELSSTEITQACLDQIEATDDRYRAFLHVAADEALCGGGRRRQGGHRRRAASVAAGRGPAGTQGRVHHDRHAHHLRVKNPRGLAFPL